MIEKELFDFSNNLKPFCSAKSCYPILSHIWDNENPFMGHCAIITLYMFENFGGKIKRGIIVGDNISHYWNEINGKDYDFTKEQFLESVKIRFTGYKTKEEMLSNTNFKTRYNLFKKEVNRVPNK